MTITDITTPIKSYVFQGSIDKTGSQVVGGKGVRIDIERDEKIHENILDAITGAAVGALGWGDDDVKEIINKAAADSTYSYPCLISNKSAEKLACKILH